MEASDYDNDTSKKPDYIPGSVALTSVELQANRSDGPVFNDSMMASGSQMDGVLNKLGITKDHRNSFTSKPGYAAARAWWTFLFTGDFSRKRILNYLMVAHHSGIRKNIL